MYAFKSAGTEHRRQTYQLGGVHVGQPVHQVLDAMHNQIFSRTASTVFQPSPAAKAIFNLGNTNLASTRASWMMLVNFGLVHLSHRCVTHTGAEYGSDTDASKWNGASHYWYGATKISSTGWLGTIVYYVFWSVSHTQVLVIHIIALNFKLDVSRNNCVRLSLTGIGIVFN